MPHFLVPLVRQPERRHGVRVGRSGVMVASHLETAFDSRARRRGLLGRDALDSGWALVMAPCSSVHTAFMRFPIDVVFTSRDGRVLKVARGLRPWRAAFAFRAFAVIELAAGAAAAGGVQRGDTLEVIEIG